MEKVSFGERLRECRAEKGLTQAQLADRKIQIIIDHQQILW